MKIAILALIATSVLGVKVNNAAILEANAEGTKTKAEAIAALKAYHKDVDWDKVWAKMHAKKG